MASVTVPSFMPVTVAAFAPLIVISIYGRLPITALFRLKVDFFCGCGILINVGGVFH